MENVGREIHIRFRCIRKIAKKKTISFVMPVCQRLSALNNLVTTRQIFMKFEYFAKGYREN